MKTNICKTCGKEFEYDWNRTKIYCSNKCLYKFYEGTPKRIEWRKIYEQTPERKEYWKDYRKSESRKLVLDKYNSSEKGKLCRKIITARFREKHGEEYINYRRKYNKKYFSSPQGREYRQQWDKSPKRKEYLKKYRQTPKYLEYHYQYKNWRERNLGFVPIMDNPFPKEIPIEYHHINNKLVFPIPKMIHRHCYNKQVSIHRQKCNEKLKNIGFDLSMFNQKI